MLVGYARVSTDLQTTDGQIDALNAAGCERVFKEWISGTRADRPQLAAALEFAREGDVLVVARLDRYGAIDAPTSLPPWTRWRHVASVCGRSMRTSTPRPRPAGLSSISSRPSGSSRWSFCVSAPEPPWRPVVLVVVLVAVPRR